MAIQGPLRELGVHDVFQLLDLGRKTGVLRVTSELRQNQGCIWFAQGVIVAATMTDNPTPLGELLLRKGRIRMEDLARAQKIQETEGHTRRIGEILVSIGAIRQRDLDRQVRAQVEEVVLTLLGWSEGYFIFEEAEILEAPRDADIGVATESLLLESARRLDEWSRIQSLVPHAGVIPRLNRQLAQGTGVLHLVPLEWKVIAQVNGLRDVREIAAAIDQSEFTTARAVFGLISALILVS